MTSGAGPDAADRLLLAACLSPFAPAGEQHDLLALLHHRLGDVDGRLAGVARRTWVENGLTLRTLAAALGALESAGVEALLAADVAAAELYALPRARPLRRLRVLVSLTDRAAAARCLLDAGWSLRPAQPGVLAVDPDAATWLDGDGGEVEVAWSLGADVTVPGTEGEDEELWAAAAGAVVPGLGRVRRLGTLHLLVWLLGEQTGWSPQPQLLRLADTATALGAVTAAKHEELVAELARRHLVPTALRNLHALAGAVPGVVPDALLDALGSAPATRRDRLAAAVQPHLLVLARHLHATAELPPHLAVLRLPGALRDSWGLHSVRDVPAAAVRHVRDRISSSAGSARTRRASLRTPRPSSSGP